MSERYWAMAMGRLPWGTTRPSLRDQLHREALVVEARQFVYIVDGTPVRFTEAEAERLAFLVWRLEDGRVAGHVPRTAARGVRTA